MDQLTLSTPENVDAVVAKVRKWLARKRFYAAGHAVVAGLRLCTCLRGVRSFRRFRQAANVMVRIVRWFVADGDELTQLNNHTDMYPC